MKIEINIPDEDAACICANWDLPPAVAIAMMVARDAAEFRQAYPVAAKNAGEKLAEFTDSKPR
jgi:hypothetical protein